MLFVNKLKVLTLMTCLVLVGQGFAANCAADYVPPDNLVWDGTSTEEPCTIDGFYIIDNAKKLAWYAAYDSDKKGNFTKDNAKLTADIDLGGKLWIPIAAGKGGGTEYTKIFDGNGHVIYNLYIKASELAQKNKEYAQNLGFVGVLGGGTIKNLILENVNIQAATNAGSINGMTTDNQISVGAVVGWMSEKGSSRVDTCMASGTIRTTGNGQGVGGIVGNAKKGAISNCLSLVEIHTSGSDSYVGGIIGITKTDVTVSSCVYAGPGLTNTGAEGLTGGIAGNVFTGKLTTNDNYFEGTGINGVGGTICKSKKNECTSANAASAANSIANADAQNVNETNADNVACALNGTNDNGSCKEEPWSVGLTGLSLNGYGADGYKIIFNANGGNFAGSVVTKNVYLASGMAITDNEVGKPSRNGFSFEGWAATADANESLQNLGTVSKSAKFYAVWALLDTIKFNVTPGTFSDGDVEKTKLVAKGEIITVEGLGDLPAARCKTYASENECKTWSYFTGWALTEGGSESDTVSLDTVIAEQGKILYAVWTDVETYTVTYNANHHGRTTVDYVRVGDGESVEEPDEPLADDGYEFVGWFTDEAGNSSYSFSAEIHENIILYAKWSLKHFDITYVMNNVGSKGENPDKYTIDTAFVLKEPADVEGYKFEGWFYDAGFTKPVSQVIQGTTGDKTFYAKWTKKTYRIMYLADNNSQGAITDQFKEHGTPLTLESAGYFNRKGYAQTGWATVANGEKVYEFGANYEENAALTLYPSWSDPIVYTITYVCDGCVNNSLNPEKYTVLTSTGIKYASSVPEGYKFGGWFSDKKFTKKVTQIEAGTVGNMTLYGKLNTVYSITYVGTDKPNSAKTYTVDDAVALNTPADSAGYTFGGWFTNANFEGDAVTGIVKGSTGDTTFYAKWVPVPYTITYNIDGEPAELTPNTYTAASATELATPTRNGYEFDGWYTNAEFNGDKATSIAAGSIGDTAFFAKWTPVEYSITYVLEEGASNDNDNPASYTVETEAITLKDAVKNGYTFEGWFNGEGEKVTTVAGGATGNLELTAQFTIETYTITYHNIEGASFEAENPTSYKVETLPIVLNNPTKDGYNFEGWFTDESFTENPITGIETRLSNGNGDLYAKWSDPIEYTITYVGADDLENLNPTSYTVLENDLALQPVSKSGFKFLGWFNESDELVESISAGSTGDITLTAKWAEFPILITQSGGVKILQNEDETVVAEIDGNSTETVSFTEDVSVDRVTFDRTFSESVNSTIMLPFTVSVNDVDGGVFYEFANLDQDESGNYHFRVKEPSASTLEANKPYIFIPSAKSITFNLSDRVTINTSVDNPTSSGNWHFIGTYQTRTFTSADPEFGYAYGFAGEEKNGLTLGKFHKVKENARLKPMRGYLLYDESRAMTKSSNVNFSERLSIFDLPEDIDVEILSNSGVVIGGGTYNTRTGVFKMDRWYDLQGRKLNGKPTVQGTYYHNGKRVIVK